MVVVEGIPRQVNKHPIVVLAKETRNANQIHYLVHQGEQVFELIYEEDTWFLGKRLSE